MAAELPQRIDVAGTTCSLYAQDFTHVIAKCSVDRIFIDHRKVGFFQIRLLPVLVAQGVRLELHQTLESIDALRKVQSNLTPQMTRHSLEWRDVEINFPGTNGPHIHAQSARMVQASGPVVCQLERVTIEGKGANWQLAKADLLTEPESRKLMGRTAEGFLFQLNLLTGEIICIQPNTRP